MTRALAILVALTLAGCAHVAGYQGDVPTCLTERPELLPACSAMARYIGHPLYVVVVPDGTPVPGHPGNTRSPWSYRPHGGAYCTIVLQETPAQRVAAGERGPLPHEALHCALWVHTGDPDRDHAGPWWPQ